MSSAYPILLDLTGRRAVIVGGGRVAARKATGLLTAGAEDITAVAPAFADGFPQAGVRRVVWDDYFRYDHAHDFSAFQYILSNPALAWAFWLLLGLFAIIYLFDSKRRQRRVPVVLPLSNTSLDFVRTIGRLYYQRRDNHNLALKMMAHFQDQVRTRYHVNVTTMDETFVERLANRTGYSKPELESLTGYMRDLPAKAYVPDQELMDLHHRLEAFYKHS